MTQPDPLNWLQTVAQVSVRTFGPTQTVQRVLKTLQDHDINPLQQPHDLIALGTGASIWAKTWQQHVQKPQFQFVAEPTPDTGTQLQVGKSFKSWIAESLSRRPLVVWLSDQSEQCLDIPKPTIRSEDFVQWHRQCDQQTQSQIQRWNICAQWSTLRAGGGFRLLGDRPLVTIIQSSLDVELGSWIAGGMFDPGPYPIDPKSKSIYGQIVDNPNWQKPTPVPTNHRQYPFIKILAGSNVGLLKTAAQIIRHEGLQTDVQYRHLVGDPIEDGKSVANHAQTSDAKICLFGGTFLTKHLGHNNGYLGQLVLAYIQSNWQELTLPILAIQSSGQDSSSQFSGVWWRASPIDMDLVQHCLTQNCSDLFFGQHASAIQWPQTGASVGPLVMTYRET